MPPRTGNAISLDFTLVVADDGLSEGDETGINPTFSAALSDGPSMVTVTTILGLSTSIPMVREFIIWVVRSTVYLIGMILILRGPGVLLI